ncbi:WD40-repeat-containing domain protein, partial [Kalaharituber pfeilii]
MEATGSDYQGIPWDMLGITSEEFREFRKQTYKNYRNITHNSYSVVSLHTPDLLPYSRRFFRFNRQDNTKRTRVGHFQLRNLLGVTSRNDIYYSTEHCKIKRTGAGLKHSEVVMDLSTGTGAGTSPVKITTMTTKHGVCIAGGFSGEYAMKNLESSYESKPIVGTITLNDNGITNHVHAHLGRNSGSPVAVFSSNDNKLRVLDCYRNTFIGEQSFDWAINCSATSPDGRLRVVVGDKEDVKIVDADTGNVLRTLEGHLDYGFSCAWSDDGYTIATGNQDMTVRIYDARNFSRSLTQIGAKMAGVRALRFSEVGTGRRVLVCPEPADYLHIVDAVTWDGAQRFEFLGEIGGVEFAPNAGEMFVANVDLAVGGLMEFER